MRMTQSLHRALRLFPQRIATVHGTRTHTVAQLADRVARFASALAALGVNSGARVGILALNSDRYHEVLLAVPWCGAVVNPMNTRWTIPEIALALHESRTAIILVDEAFRHVVSALQERVPGLTTIVYIGDAAAPPGWLDYEQLIDQNSPCDDSGAGGSDLFGLFYTGGTTGTPKAVMLSHDNVLTAALGTLASEELVVRQGRILHAAPMFHLAEIGCWVLGNLVDSTHVTIPAFTVESVARAAEDHSITDVLLVPTMLQMLVDQIGDARSFHTVQTILYGASPISDDLLRRAMRLFTSARFVQAYGMTELAPFASVLAARDHEDPLLRRSAGKMLIHNEIAIFDDSGREVSRGEVGEIVVRGPNVMRGYWNLPEATAAALAGGWMHTGDAGFMDEDGYLFVVDRIKDMIITGGENVYSIEVENALSQHSAVASCAVVGVPDARWGEAVHAVVVLRQGAEASEEKLRDHCRALIANYKVPRAITFVERMPTSAAGKVLKRDLAATLVAS